MNTVTIPITFIVLMVAAMWALTLGHPWWTLAFAATAMYHTPKWSRSDAQSSDDKE